MLWALAALDALPPGRLAEMAAWLDEPATLAAMGAVTASQLAQADEVVRAASPSRASALPARLRARLAEVQGGAQRMVSTSRLQASVSGALARLGVPHAVEARVSSPDYGDVVVDILLEGGAIAVEVDGPSHVTALPPHRNLGHTALRNRLLEARSVWFFFFL